MKELAILVAFLGCFYGSQARASAVALQGPSPTPTPMQIPTPIPTPALSPSTPGQTPFALALGKGKLLGLRAFKASQQGKTTVTPCPGWTGSLPLPQPKEYQSYFDTFGATLNVAASFGDTGANGIPSARVPFKPRPLGKLNSSQIISFTTILPVFPASQH